MRVLNRRWRTCWAWIALLSFAFAQLAVAAYVCPDTSDKAQFSAAAEGDCHGSGGQSHDTDNAQLCKAHCEGSAQVKPSALIDPPALADVAIPAPVAHLAAAGHSCERSDFCLPPSGGPPLYLRNCVLRN